jgi:hypothetical protein
LLAATMKVCRERLPANANRHGREPLAISFVGVITMRRRESVLL